MADKKISALTAASTPLAGTEVLPIVQSGATVKVAVSSLTSFAPAFSASLSTNQTVTASTTTKLTFNTEQFDTNSNYDNTTNYRFTPTVAGYYQINVTLDLADASVAVQDVLARLYKNGSQYLAPIRRQTGAGAEVGITIAQLVNMNGSTDYLEVYLQQVSGTNVIVYANSNFCGSLVRGA